MELTLAGLEYIHRWKFLMITNVLALRERHKWTMFKWVWLNSNYATGVIWYPEHKETIFGNYKSVFSLLNFAYIFLTILN